VSIQLAIRFFRISYSLPGANSGSHAESPLPVLDHTIPKLSTAVLNFDTLGSKFLGALHGRVRPGEYLSFKSIFDTFVTP